jgi:hypothetical protein
MGEHRNAGGRQHRLGHRQGERAEPGAEAADQHDGVDRCGGVVLRAGKNVIGVAPGAADTAAQALPARRLAVPGGCPADIRDRLDAWWASLREDGIAVTLSAPVLRFDEAGQVVEHTDYWVHDQGRRSPFPGWVAANGGTEIGITPALPRSRSTASAPDSSA